MIYRTNNNRGFYKKSRGKPNLNFGIIIFILIICAFFVRLISVLSNNKERGAFFYVQLLNLGMPVVESQIYDEGNYAENRESLSNVTLQVFGLNNLTYQNIIKNELSILKTFDDTNIESVNSYNHSFRFNPFTVSDDSISKVTPNQDATATTNTGIYNPNLKKTLDTSKPEVLIYHTHTNENYDANSPDSYSEDSNVVGVGDVLENELRDNYGINVVHDKTDHCKSYNDSYLRSGETIDKDIKKYGNFKIIIDLHRDSINNKATTTTEVAGQSASKIMFVNAKNSARYAKNKELTERINNTTNSLFPGLSRGIYTYNRGKSAFNQSKSDGCLLFEIGSHTNTPSESKVTALCMARVIAEILNGK